jgi:hypothetical protein
MNHVGKQKFRVKCERELHMDSSFYLLSGRVPYFFCVI